MSITVTDRAKWLMIGAGMGAGVALLYAPQNGERTRKFLGRKWKRTRETLVNTGGHVRDTIAGTGGTLVSAGRKVYRTSVGVFAGHNGR
jgi:gas vesicle protein